MISRTTRWVLVTSVSFITSLAILSSSGCFGRLPGSAEDALQARQSYTEGRLLLASVRSEIVNLFSHVAVVPVAKALLLEAATGGQILVTQQMVSDAYGSYRETSTGVFEYTLDARNSIEVYFLNGVDASLHSFQFAGNAVEEFRLSVSSNNRSIATPEADYIDMELGMAKPSPDIADRIDELQDFSPTFTLFAGKVSYVRNGARVAYEVLKAGTELEIGFDESDTLVIVAITQAQTFNVREVSNSPSPVGNRYWNYNEASVYRATADPSIWVAVSRNVNYNDSNGVRAVVGVLTDLKTLATGGNFVGYNPGLVANVIYDRRLVADAGGGTYYCDMTAPNLAGGGNPVIIRWVDEINQDLMPTREFSCARSVIRRSAAAMTAAAARK